MKKFAPIKMVDMEWRIKKKNLLQRSEAQVLPLTWMGQKIPRVETRLRLDP